MVPSLRYYSWLVSVYRQIDSGKISVREVKTMSENNNKKGLDQQNGSMASNMEEVERLGKEMEQMKTNKDLAKEDNKQSDPAQHVEEHAENK